MLWKSFYKLRIPLLTEMTALLYIRLLQVHFHWCLADSASEVLPKNRPRYMRGVCVYHLNRCKTSDWFSLICRGVQSTVETAPNEAIHLCWKQSLINSVYLQNLVSTVDQAVTLRCFESTRLPQSVLHASEPSSDFRRNHIADSIMFFDLFSPRPCRRRTMGYFGKQSPKHYFGFPHAGQNSMESGYDYV